MAISPALQEWIQRRVDAVDHVYGAFDALTEHGVEIPERSANFQIPCPYHNDSSPSSRYYGATNRTHFHCFVCKIHENGIGLYARFKGIKFIEALSTLERRFNIKIPRKPDSPEMKEPEDKGSHYESTAWSDIPRVLAMLEKKLVRLRDKASLIDFVKFCKVLDSVQWDLDHNGNVGTPQMSDVLIKVRKMMDELTARESICGE
jgi:hypothetical protein